MKFLLKLPINCGTDLLRHRIAEKSSWRWVVCYLYANFPITADLAVLQFRSTTIADAIVQIVGLFALRESKFDYHQPDCVSFDWSTQRMLPCFWRGKPRRYLRPWMQRKATLGPSEQCSRRRTKGKVRLLSAAPSLTTPLSWQIIMSAAMVRPFVMFWEEPILQIFGIYFAFLYGMIYCEINFL